MENIVNDFDKTMIRDYNGLLLSKDEIEVLRRYDIHYENYNSMKELIYEIEDVIVDLTDATDLEEVSIYIINKMFKLYPEYINKRYNVNYSDDIVEILDNIGKKIGAFRNNETDYDRVYVTILKDLREGYLGKVTFDEI